MKPMLLCPCPAGVHFSILSRPQGDVISLLRGQSCHQGCSSGYAAGLSQDGRKPWGNGQVPEATSLKEIGEGYIIAKLMSEFMCLGSTRETPLLAQSFLLLRSQARLCAEQTCIAACGFRDAPGSIRQRVELAVLMPAYWPQPCTGARRICSVISLWGLSSGWPPGML